MKFLTRLSFTMGLVAVAGFGSPTWAQEPGAAAEPPFLAENEAAMAKMMSDMNVKPTGDVDRDFVAMMIPHHQGAVAMAQAMLRYGHNEQLRRLAQEIIVTQQQEIVTMRLAIGDPPIPAASAPTQPQAAPLSDQKAMPDHHSMQKK